MTREKRLEAKALLANNIDCRGLDIISIDEYYINTMGDIIIEFAGVDDDERCYYGYYEAGQVDLEYAGQLDDFI